MRARVPVRRSGGCLSTTWYQPRYVMVRTRSDGHHADAISIQRAPPPAPGPPRTGRPGAGPDTGSHSTHSDRELCPLTPRLGPGPQSESARLPPSSNFFFFFFFFHSRHAVLLGTHERMDVMVKTGVSTDADCDVGCWGLLLTADRRCMVGCMQLHSHHTATSRSKQSNRAPPARLAKGGTLGCRQRRTRAAVTTP